MARFCSWLLDHSRWSLSLIVLLSAGWLLPLRHLEFDSSSSSFIQATSKENTYFEKIQKIFGNDEILLIGISSDRLLERPMLEQIREITAKIEKVDGVKRVLSLTNLMDVEGQDDEVNIKPLVPENLEQLNPGDLRIRLQSNPLLGKQFISKDLRTTSILVFLETFEHAKALSQGRFVTQQVHEIWSAAAARGSVHWRPARDGVRRHHEYDQ